VTLPKHVREALGLRTGELVETVLTPEGALTRPVELRPRKIDVKSGSRLRKRMCGRGGVYGPFKTASATCVR